MFKGNVMFAKHRRNSKDTLTGKDAPESLLSGLLETWTKLDSS